MCREAQSFRQECDGRLDKFRDFARQIMSVPRSAIQPQLDAEKENRYRQHKAVGISQRINLSWPDCLGPRDCAQKLGIFPVAIP